MEILITNFIRPIESRPSKKARQQLINSNQGPNANDEHGQCERKDQHALSINKIIPPRDFEGLPKDITDRNAQNRGKNNIIKHRVEYEGARYGEGAIVEDNKVEWDVQKWCSESVVNRTLAH